MYSCTVSSTEALDRGWTRPFYTLEGGLVPTVQETGCSSGLVEMGTENLTVVVRTPDHPTCSKSLYRLLSWLLH